MLDSIRTKLILFPSRPQKLCIEVCAAGRPARGLVVCESAPGGVGDRLVVSWRLEFFFVCFFFFRYISLGGVKKSKKFCRVLFFLLAVLHVILSRSYRGGMLHGSVLGCRSRRNMRHTSYRSWF